MTTSVKSGVHRRPPRLALALLGLATALALLAICLPVWWALELHRTLATHQQTLATLQEAKASGTGLADAMSTVALLAAENAGRGSAELLARVDDVARTSGVHLRSTQVLLPRKDGDVLRISIEIVLQGDTAQTTRFLHILETGFPVLLIDEATMRAMRSTTGGPPAAVSLDTSVKLHGFIQTREGRAPG